MSEFELTADDRLRELRVVAIPLCGREWAALRVPYPMTETQWTEMVDLLALMKLGIVSEEVRK